MERIVYDRMAELDARHWCYRARREVLAKLISRKVKPKDGARILEIGCCTGHNLAMLGRFGSVDAIEVDAAARAVADTSGRHLDGPFTDSIPWVTDDAIDPDTPFVELDLLDRVLVAAAAAVFRHHKSRRRALATDSRSREPWLARGREDVARHAARPVRGGGAQ